MALTDRIPFPRPAHRGSQRASAAPAQPAPSDRELKRALRAFMKGR